MIDYVLLGKHQLPFGHIYLAAVKPSELKLNRLSRVKIALSKRFLIDLLVLLAIFKAQKIFWPYIAFLAVPVVPVLDLGCKTYPESVGPFEALAVFCYSEKCSRVFFIQVTIKLTNRGVARFGTKLWILDQNLLCQLSTRVC